MAHLHNVYDSDSHFVIDAVTRNITNESSKKTMVMQYDHNSERFTFELPRIVEGHDMSLCDRIEVHYLNIDASDKSKKITGIYEVDDLQISPDDKNTVVFSWLLSQNVTQYAGSLSFIIRFSCVSTDGIASYIWNTAIYSGITISSGILNDAEALIEPYLDVIAQWKADLFGVGDTQEARLLRVSAEQQAAITAEGEKQVSAVAGKGAAVLDSIPDEYEVVSALADNNYRNKAGAIVLEAEGESIVVNDASEYHLQGLKVFGKSTQDGTPSPEYPQEINSVDNAAVMVHGKNLIPFPYHEISATKSGTTFTVNNDGTITLNGTPTGATSFILSYYTKKVLRVQGGQQYKFKALTTPGALGGLYAYVSCDGGNPAYDIGDGVTFTPEKDGYATVCLVVGMSAGTLENVLIKPQLEIGNETTDYEPYTEQNITIPRKIQGIPTVDVGNFTDASNQKWICDEVDLKRGVFIQRIKTVELDASSDEYWYSINATGGVIFAHALNDAIAEGSSKKLYCSHFKSSVTDAYNKIDNACYFYDKTFRICHMNIDDLASFKEWLKLNPITLNYILAEPVEIPLSDAEITAFKALHSNKPTTTIMNDCGAYMAAEYIADTKTYIDNKISELLKGSETE